MKNKIIAIVAAVLATALLVFSIGFSCFAPRVQIENPVGKVRDFFFGSPYSIFWDDRDYGDYSYDYYYDESNYTYNDFYDESSYDFFEPTGQDWIEIYSQTCIRFINADSSLLEGIEAIWIETDDFIAASDSEREEIIKLIKEQTDYPVLTIDFDDLYRMEQNAVDTQTYFLINIDLTSSSSRDIYITGFSQRYPSGDYNYLHFVWEPDADGKMTITRVS